MEEMAKLGDLALKLERYRSHIASALDWVVYGMIFGSLITLGDGLILLGFRDYRIFLSLIAIAWVGGWIIHVKLVKMMPEVREIRRRWRIGSIFIFAPFIVSYFLVPLIIRVSGFYYSTIWYPSLGFGLLLAGLYAERGENYPVRSATYAGILILLTSLILIPISKLPMNFNVILGSGLLCSSMTIFIYFVVFAYVFFRAQRVFYA